jgi:hypothetical protein
LRPICDRDATQRWRRVRLATSNSGRYFLCITIRDKVERLLDRLSEEELAAEYQRLRQIVDGERTLDDWGDLERFSARASRGVLRHMTEDEKKAGLSWTDPDPQPGDFDAELDRARPDQIETHKGSPGSTLSILVSVAGDDAKRLERIATERGEQPGEVISQLLRRAVR